MLKFSVVRYLFINLTFFEFIILIVFIYRSLNDIKWIYTQLDGVCNVH